MERNDYYVYLHLDPNTGIPFNCGKGNGRRFKRTIGRSDLWWDIVNKVGFDPIIIEENLSEKKALELETYWCKRIGRRNNNTGPLINTRDGDYKQELGREDKFNILLDKGFKYCPISGKIFGIKGQEITAKTDSGYITVRFRHNNKGYGLRGNLFAWYYVHGYCDTDKVDHKNNIRTDNRICNLRNTSSAVNSQNRVGVNGYFFMHDSSKYRVLITLFGKKYHIGDFILEGEAKNKYNEVITLIYKDTELVDNYDEIIKSCFVKKVNKNYWFNKKNNTWDSYINVKGKKIHIGFFKTEEEAIKSLNHIKQVICDQDITNEQLQNYCSVIYPRTRKVRVRV